MERKDYKNKIVVFNGSEAHMKVGTRLRVEGYWDEITGKTWQQAFNEGNPGATVYAVRAILSELPMDSNVLYTHSVVSNLGHLVHVSEIELEEVK